MEYLRRPSRESVVFLLFLQERTQKEAIEFMYDKSYSSINIEPFKESRERLLDDGILESDGSLRNAKFQSDPTILLDKIEEKADWRDKDLSAEEITGIKMMLNSDWFREFFNLDHFEALDGVARESETGAIEVRKNGAMEVMGLVFDDISMIGRKSFEDVAEYDAFEDYLNEQPSWGGKFSPEKTFDIATRDLEDYVGEHRLPWKTYFWKRITVEEECMFYLPGIDFAVYHWGSSILHALREMKREAENSDHHE